jgi:cysteine desulfurase
VSGIPGSAVIYLDNAATTAVDPRVVEAMSACLGEPGDYANPSAMSHAPGRRASARVEVARAQVAALVGADPACIVWTSGATEADNLAVLGAARYYRTRGRHLITARTEHPAVLEPCRQLEREGFEVTYLKPAADGIVEAAQVEEALRADTVLVSLMHVNNEIGVEQDVAAVGRLCRARGVLLHVDAAQGAGKLPIDVERDGIDLLSFTAHKLHGPKGVGALCVRREPRLGLVPLLHGGGQERGLRPGTLATHQVVGFGEACRIAALELDADARRVGVLRERLWAGLRVLPGTLLNGHPTRRVPGILSVTFDGVEGESLLHALPGLAVASGSACASTSAQPSYVLRALGRSDRLAQSSLRLSLGRYTTATEIDRAVADITAALERLRRVAPLPAR